MAPSILKKRKTEDTASKRPNKKFRKQQHYSSPSASSASEADEDPQEFTPVDLADSSEDDPSPLHPQPVSSKDANSFTLQPSTSATDSDDPPNSSDSSNNTHSTSTSPAAPPRKKTQKRNDPTAFATSIATILSSKLTTTKRSDPVLARSATAQDADSSLANSKLEAKAKRKIRDDRRAALERGRVKDVLLGTSTAAGEGKGEGGKSVGQLQEEERKLRKTAQRGVVKLFNAVRASQVRAEEARAKGGTRGRKEERVDEMSKLGFLEMVAAGGGGGGKGNMKGKGKEELVGEGIEEA